MLDKKRARQGSMQCAEFLKPSFAVYLAYLRPVYPFPTSIKTDLITDRYGRESEFQDIQGKSPTWNFKNCDDFRSNGNSGTVL